MLHLLKVLPIMLLTVALHANSENFENLSSFEHIVDIEQIGNKVYIATQGGLAVWDQNDGSKTFYNRGNSNISANRLTDLQVDNQSRLWVGSFRGIQTFEEGNFSDIIVGNGYTMAQGRNASEAIVYARQDSLIIVYHDGSQQLSKFPYYFAEMPAMLTDTQKQRTYVGLSNWFGPSGLAAYEGNQWLEPEDSVLLVSGWYNLQVMCFDQQDRFVLITDQATYTLDEETWLYKSHADNFDDEYMAPASLTLGPNGSLWLATNEGTGSRVFQYAQDSWTEHLLPELADMQISRLQFRQDGRMLIGTKGHGLFEIHDSELSKVDLKQSVITNNNITAILPYFNGMLVADGATLRHAMQSGMWHTLPSVPNTTTSVTYLCSDSNSRLWHLRGAELHRYDHLAEQWYYVDNPLSNNGGLMEAGEDGTLWIQEGGNIFRMANETWTTFPASEHGLPGTNFRDLLVTDSGGLWASSHLGLAHYDGNSWTQYLSVDFPFSHSTQMALASNGDLWFLSQEGLNKLSPAGLEQYELDLELFSPWTFQLYIDQEEQLWITGSGALIKFFEGELEIFNMENSCIAEGQYRTVAQDENGTLWLGSNQAGLVLFNENGLDSGNAIQVAPSPSTNTFQLYPNPVSSNQSIKIGLNSIPSLDAIIEIHDLFGRLLYTSKLPPHEYSLAVDFALPELPAGSYLLTLSDQHRKTSQGLIVH